MDVQYLSSDLLNQAGLKHGWFMRFGGVSTGSRESLNGKRMQGEIDSNVDENRARAATKLGRDSGSLTHILHSFEDSVLEATKTGEFASYDASITTNPALTLMQTTADCGTIIITNSNASKVALVHGSWHTLNNGIITKVINKLGDSDLNAGIGPMICKKCYEFGQEAVSLFDSKYLEQKGNKYLVDLKKMVLDQLSEAGVKQVDDMNVCTFEDDRFFSARRDGQASGRFMTLAALPDVI